MMTNSAWGKRTGTAVAITRVRVAVLAVGVLSVGVVGTGAVLMVGPAIAATTDVASPSAAAGAASATGSDDWQLAGTMGVARIVIVPMDRIRDAEGYQRQIDRLCPPGETCFVNFHTNSSGAEVRLPLPDAISNEVTARYRHSAKVGRTIFEWSCRLRIDGEPCF